MMPEADASDTGTTGDRSRPVSPTILVMALGNDLAGDDGIGFMALEELRSRGVPRHVRLLYGRRDPLGLVEAWLGEHHVWLVDATVVHAPPGTVHCVGHDALLRARQRHRDAHALSLPELLGWLVVACPAFENVRFRLWGVEPASIAPGHAPDTRVRAGVVQLADRLLATAADVSSRRD